jgi:hypothetical protein
MTEYFCEAPYYGHAKDKRMYIFYLFADSPSVKYHTHSKRGKWKLKVYIVYYESVS